MIKNDHKWPKMMKNDMKTFEMMVIDEKLIEHWWKMIKEENLDNG